MSENILRMIDPSMTAVAKSNEDYAARLEVIAAKIRKNEYGTLRGLDVIIGIDTPPWVLAETVAAIGDLTVESFVGRMVITAVREFMK